MIGHKISAIFISLVCIFVLISCNPYKKKEMAEAKVAEFHQMINENKFNEIYERSSVEFQNTSRREDAIKFFSMIKNQFGNVEEATLQSWRVNTTTSGNQILLVYVTKYEKAEVTEEFIWIDKNNQLSLFNYSYNLQKSLE